MEEFAKKAQESLSHSQKELNPEPNTELTVRKKHTIPCMWPLYFFQCVETRCPHKVINTGQAVDLWELVCSGYAAEAERGRGESDHTAGPV